MKIGYIGTWLSTWLRGEWVGKDESGNHYFRTFRHGQERRWVIYKNEVEASHVPPEWHGWLHYTHQEPPTRQPRQPSPWGQPHQPNLTGTQDAFLPPGHALKDGHPPAATGDYEAWRP